jgi:hypothetical protein
LFPIRFGIVIPLRNEFGRTVSHNYHGWWLGPNKEQYLGIL